ncbi:MAG: 3'(2'),5'-bisphosphate nucleotidase CysQ family protein [Spirochaetota bacterium]
MLVACSKAGKDILEVYNSDDFSIEYKDKEKDSPLTKADKRSHKSIEAVIKNLIIGKDKEAFPILSEEGEDIPYESRKEWSLFWLIDPLDGTKEFINRNGEFTVNIALVDKDKPVIGAVYVPVKDIMYFAGKDMGAYKLEHFNNILMKVDSNENEIDLMKEIITQSIKLSQTKRSNNDISAVKVVASRSHMSKETEEFINKLKDKYDSIETTSAGSSLKLCMVAEGKADVYPRIAPTMEWDIAAAYVVVEEAGCDIYEWRTKKELKFNKSNLKNPYFVVSTL